MKNTPEKSADGKAQISKALVPLTGLICALRRSADFLRLCFSPRATASTRFLFPIVSDILTEAVRPIMSPYVRSLIKQFKNPHLQKSYDTILNVEVRSELLDTFYYKVFLDAQHTLTSGD